MVAQLDRPYVSFLRGRTLVRLLSYAAFEGRPLTTRGRWVNPLVQAHLAAGTRFPSTTVDRPIFVLGVGRSGTTLLGKLLGGHPHVGFLNEPKALWHAVRDDEDIIGTYSPTPGRLRLGADDATPDVVSRARRLFAYYAWVTRSKRVVDKYPELVFRHAFVRTIFPDARFVVITRDAPAVAASITRWSQERGTADANWWGLNDRKWQTLWAEGVGASPELAPLANEVDPATRDDRIRALVEWLLVAREALAIQAEPHVHLLRYEDLVADPPGALGQLLERLELPRSTALEAFAAQEIRDTVGSGNVEGLPSVGPGLADELAAARSELGYSAVR